MELQPLRYVCAIAGTGSFSRAAQQTHVSEPSLSQQIRKLEDELGARLFNRLGRTVPLTELGRAFLRDLEAARSEVVERETSISGSISVGVIPTIAPHFLPPILARFSRKYPQARVTVAEEITPLLLERLGAGTMDVAIIAQNRRSFSPLAKPLPERTSLNRCIPFPKRYFNGRHRIAGIYWGRGRYYSSRAAVCAPFLFNKNSYVGLYQSEQ
ncbi:MAG: LysR family transcriptional regulator, partial [Chthoniobacterales bacterium]